MFQESVTYPADESYPFAVVAKRYWTKAFDENTNDSEALTLIFLHSTSFHKETWEPTLTHLFHLLAGSSRVGKIREAWALDCPNHGEAAALNEAVFNRPEYRQSFTCEKYAQAAHRFLTAGPQHGAKIDFQRRNLVGIGHSLGGVAMSALQGLEPRLPFSSIIIVEPMLSPDGRHHLERLRKVLVKSAKERRHVWPDRESARQYLEERMELSKRQKWDPRVIDLFVKYGLRSHPDGITLACSREEEEGMYEDVEGPTRPVIALTAACQRMPVHIAFGYVPDYVPLQVHDATINPRSGRKFASISWIEGVGHLVPQIVPEKLAKVLFEGLAQNYAMKSKL
ncbi:hypothetical protein BDN71DRAFT_1443681 [Pleurotus eryngii]|uniref:AB hydrolase-1 domain-containing protein n=1 Tax=Pleurotus eryngii TaxID=5323 RepID=A0A9P6A3Q0_PLEER|nr:hypothetical protein BDN71DRAFT_1443681 [Pleurotus eryngii]